MSPAKARSARQSTPDRSNILLLIAIFKLVKGLALLAIGIGVLHLLHRDLEQTITHWVSVLRVDPDNHYIHQGLTRIFRVTPKQMKELSLGTFVYAGLFLTEGIGLLLRKRWAEYFTIISTSSLLPLEIYELAKHFTATRLAVLILNLAIVAYLVYNLRKSPR